MVCRFLQKDFYQYICYTTLHFLQKDFDQYICYTTLQTLKVSKLQGIMIFNNYILEIAFYSLVCL